jgi:hypothetical protein
MLCEGGSRVWCVGGFGESRRSLPPETNQILGTFEMDRPVLITLIYNLVEAEHHHDDQDFGITGAIQGSLVGKTTAKIS